MPGMWRSKRSQIVLQEPDWQPRSSGFIRISSTRFEGRHSADGGFESAAVGLTPMSQARAPHKRRRRGRSIGNALIFPHLYRRPDLMKPDLPATFFASRKLRPVMGITLYVGQPCWIGMLTHFSLTCSSYWLWVTMPGPAKASVRAEKAASGTRRVRTIEFESKDRSVVIRQWVALSSQMKD